MRWNPLLSQREGEKSVLHFFHLFTLPSLSLVSLCMQSEKSEKSDSMQSDSMQSDDKVMAKCVIDDQCATCTCLITDVLTKTPRWGIGNCRNSGPALYWWWYLEQLIISLWRCSLNKRRCRDRRELFLLLHLPLLLDPIVSSIALKHNRIGSPNLSLNFERR